MSRGKISTDKIIEGFWSHNNRQEFASGIISILASESK
jgi:hypothetical protein